MNKKILDAMNSSKSYQEDFTHENGQYVCKCIECEEIFIGNKHRCICKECATTRSKNTYEAFRG
jgi:Zn finger protein HypA/HybF involved in hydrogenase expression